MMMTTMTLLGIVFLLLNAFPIYAGVPTESHDANAMWVEPASIDLTTATVGHLFNVTVAVNITLEQLVGAWQTRLRFNSTYLHAIRADYTDVGRSNWFAGLGTVAVIPIIDNVTGYVFHGESLTGLEVDNLGAGTLFWIEFNVTFVPSELTTLTFDITTDYPDETYVLDETIQAILMTPYDSIAVIPEFSQLAMLSIFMGLALVAVVLAKKKGGRKPKYQTITNN